MRKKILVCGLISTIALSAVFGTGCSKEENSKENTSSESTSKEEENSLEDKNEVVSENKVEIKSEKNEENEKTVAVEMEGEVTGDGADVVVKSTSDNTITLDGKSASCENSGVKIDGGKVTIEKAGKYIVTGEISDGQIVVDTEDKETVWIILSDADITSKENSAIYVKNAKKTIVSAATNTTNKLNDATGYNYDDEAEEEPNACIFSKDDLVISGDGNLYVNGNFNNGIASKDTLEISSVNLSITAVNNGIKGKDSVVIKSGDISVTSKGDGIKSDNDTDKTLGYVLIENAKVDIDSEEDGIQAETYLKLAGANLTVKTGDGSGVTSQNSMWGGGSTSSETSIKGLKAGIDITVTDGNIEIDSEDDAIHSNGDFQMDGGSIKVTSGDDGLHSDNMITINGGSLNVAKSYEGIEASTIKVNGGDVDVVASDDGINAAGGNDNSSVQGRPGMNNFSSSTGKVIITNGNIYLNASGDGLDSNGSIEVSGGEVYIDGPENDGNGALDYDQSFNMTGGILVSAGSSGMLQTVSNSSTQNCISTVATSYQNAETTFSLKNENGEEIISYTPSKRYNSVVVCSPDIKSGSTYTAIMGNTEIGSVTVSSTISSIGASAGGMGGQGQRPNGMNGQMERPSDMSGQMEPPSDMGERPEKW